VDQSIPCPSPLQQVTDFTGPLPMTGFNIPSCQISPLVGTALAYTSESATDPELLPALIRGFLFLAL